MKNYSSKLKLMFILVLFFEIFFFARNSQGGTSFYVIPDDDGACPVNGDGTANQCASASGQPGYWRGFSNIHWGAGGLDGGDTLYLISGKTYKEQLTIGHAGDDVNHPITITVYGSGTATIDSENSTRLGIRLDGYSYITIDGVRGDVTSGDTNYGLKIINVLSGKGCVYDASGAGNISVQHIECSGSPLLDGYGLHTGGDAANLTDDTKSWTTNQWSGWQVVNHAKGIPCDITANTATALTTGTCYPNDAPHWSNGDTYSIGWGVDLAGIRIGQSGRIFDIGYNWIHGPLNAGTNQQLRWPVSCIIIYHPLSGTNFDDAKIHHNRCEQLQMDSIQSYNNASVYNNQVVSVRGNGWHSDGVNTTDYSKVYNNYTEDVTISFAGNNHYYSYNNVFVNVGHCLNIDARTNTMNDLHIYNNDFISCASYAIRSLGSLAISNLEIKNNYFGSLPSLGPPIVTTSNTSFADDNALDYNVYNAGDNDNVVRMPNGTDYTLLGLQALSPPREAHGALGYPSLTADYKPQANDTVLKNKGVSLSSIFALDKDGISRPQGSAWDIGAYEYVQGGDTTPPAAPTGLSVR